MGMLRPARHDDGTDYHSTSLLKLCHHRALAASASQDLLVKLSLGRIAMHESIFKDPQEVQACQKNNQSVFPWCFWQCFASCLFGVGSQLRLRKTKEH